MQLVQERALQVLDVVDVEAAEGHSVSAHPLHLVGVEVKKVQVVVLKLDLDGCQGHPFVLVVKHVRPEGSLSSVSDFGLPFHSPPFEGAAESPSLKQASSLVPKQPTSWTSQFADQAADL